MDEYTIDILFDWVSQGGTLIANNSSTRFLTSEDGIGNVKQLQNTFDESEQYNFDLLREIYSQYEDVDKDKTNNNVIDFNITYPWEELEGTLSEKELKSRDKWQSIFMPSGSIVAGRIDDEHWLTFGNTDIIPILYSNLPILMTRSDADAPVRIGQMIPNDNIDNDRDSDDFSDWGIDGIGPYLTDEYGGLVIDSCSSCEAIVNSQADNASYDSKYDLWFIDEDNDGYVDNLIGWDYGGVTDKADPDNNPMSPPTEGPTGGHQHGTHIAGIISSSVNNNLGGAGIGYSVKYMPIKIQYDESSSDTTFDHNEFSDILSLSLIHI